MRRRYFYVFFIPIIIIILCGVLCVKRRIKPRRVWYIIIIVVRVMIIIVRGVHSGHAWFFRRKGPNYETPRAANRQRPARLPIYVQFVYAAAGTYIK